MIIGVDVDDVCGDLITPTLARYNKEYGDNLTKNQILEWDISKFVKPECGKDIFKYFELKDLYDEVYPIEGALETINLIKSVDEIRVVYITTATIGSAGRKLQWLFDHKFCNNKKDYVETADKSLV
jgi:5'-nucleotidase